MNIKDAKVVRRMISLMDEKNVKDWEDENTKRIP